MRKQKEREGFRKGASAPIKHCNIRCYMLPTLSIKNTRAFAKKRIFGCQHAHIRKFRTAILTIAPSLLVAKDLGRKKGKADFIDK